MDVYHKSVLLKEVIEGLGVAKDKWYVDATLGDGGHTVEILSCGGKVFGVDVDPYALQRTKKRLRDLGFDESRFRLVQGNFRDIKNLLQTEPTKFAGAIFDLGVSSLQLESPQRGFSFSKMGPLDMRMDPSLAVKALDLIQGLNKGELYELFTKLGEEKFAKELADTLVSTRKIGYRVKGIGFTTLDLAKLVENVYRRHGIKRWKIHPATKVFQALRIAVNDELNALKEGLEQAKDLIEKNGCILVISFHSLEDRIIKFTFRKWEAEGFGRVVVKKPIVSGPAEIAQNPRSRSAKMRIFKIA